MDDEPKREVVKTKNEYIIVIDCMLEECQDLALLDLIYRMLMKSY